MIRRTSKTPDSVADIVSVGSMLAIARTVLHPTRLALTMKNLLLFAGLARRPQALEAWGYLYDAVEYLELHSDVAESGLPPTLHYLVFGNSERRIASSRFDTGYYLDNNPDVQADGINALLHFCLFGTREGRLTMDQRGPSAQSGDMSGLEAAPDNYWPEDRPILSIVIPCYNYGAYVEAALQSVLDQTWKDLEVIVVDAGSTDGTTVAALKELEARGYPGVRFYYREGRHLVGDNRNFGIARANGRYICCLDADDLLVPIYLEVALFLLEGFGYDLAYCSSQSFGESDSTWMLVDASFPEILDNNQVSTVAVFRKSAWAHSGGYRDWGLGGNHVPEDWDFWARLLGYGYRAKAISEPLFLYRVRAGSLSNANGASLEAQALEIRKSCQPLAHRRRRSRRGPRNIGNRWINTNRGGAGRQPTFLMCLPFATIGGAETLMHSIAEGVAALGYRLVIVTTQPLAPSMPDRWKDFREISDHVYNLPTLFRERYVAEEFLYHLIRCHSVSTLFFAGSTFVYDLLPELRAAFPDLRIVDQLFNAEVHAETNRRNASHIDVTVVPSEPLRDVITAMAEGDAGDIRVIHHSVPVPADTEEEPSELRRAAGLPEDRIIVGFYGRLSREKGPEQFVEIVARLASREDLHFVMTGVGPELNRVEELIRQRKLEGRILRPGFVPDVTPLLEATDIVVVPSLFDGMPLIVLEAMARRKAVVASAVGSLPAVLREGETGFLCKPGDVDEFAARIVAVADDPLLRNAVGAAARKHVLQNYSSEAMIRSYGSAFFGPAGAGR